MSAFLSSCHFPMGWHPFEQELMRKSKDERGSQRRQQTPNFLWADVPDFQPSCAIPELFFAVHHLAWDNPMVLLGRFRKKPYNSFFNRLRVMKVLWASCNNFPFVMEIGRGNLINKWISSYLLPCKKRRMGTGKQAPALTIRGIKPNHAASNPPGVLLEPHRN